MSFRGKYLKIDDFSGGDCSALAPTLLNPNQALGLDNIIIYPEGKGFRSRGLTAYSNSTEFGSADAFPVIGVGILEKSDGTNHVLAIKKGKAYGGLANDGRTTTYTDRTAAIVISTGTTGAERAGYRWSFCTHNDLLIGFGGPSTAPDAPFKWAGETNNIAALGGTPPSALFGFSENNRVFACRTAANPSIFQWTVLGNPEDWTGTGSGSVTVGNLNDGEPLEAACVISRNLALLFKRNSIYQVDLTAAPFAPQLLFKGVGAMGVNSVAVADGVAYFLTPQKQFMATDGNKIITIPPNSSKLSAMVIGTTPLVFRLRSRSGASFQSPEFDMIVVCGLNSSAATDGVVITAAWDMKNKCWLYFSTGYQFISGATKQGTGYFYGGWSNQGRVFYPEFMHPFSGVLTTDDTGVSSGAINSYWQSGHLKGGLIDEYVRLIRAELDGGTYYSAATVTMTYGYDLGSLSKTASFAFNTSLDKAKASLNGKGGEVSFKIAFSASSDQGMIEIRSLTLGGRIPVGAKAAA